MSQSQSTSQPISNSAVRVTIVIEWENILLAEYDRARRMLRQVGRQVAELGENRSSSRGAVPQVRFPVEILFLFNPADVEEKSIRETVEACLEGDPQTRSYRFIPVEGGSYYVLKNHGARHATGDIVVLLDTDTIPALNWLVELLRPFSDSKVQVVGGHTYLATDTLIERAMALGWFYPLRETEVRLETRPLFYANNLAMRREVMLEHPFSDLPGTNRNACSILARHMYDIGIPPYINTAAQLEHPAPYGLKAVLRRAVVHGRDDLLMIQHWAPPHKSGIVRALGRTWRLWGRGMKNTLFRYRRANLSPLEIPATVGILSLYYTLYFLGDLGTRVAPDYMQRHFQI